MDSRIRCGDFRLDRWRHASCRPGHRAHVSPSCGDLVSRQEAGARRSQSRWTGNQVRHDPSGGAWRSDPRSRTRILGGVVFIGTPHQGSSLATIADLLRGVLRLNPQVTNIASDDAWLKVLNGQFRHLQAKRKFQVRVFFETKRVLLGRKILGFAFGPRVIVVDRNSSDPGIPGFVAIGLEGDHIQIAKPRSRDELVHKSLVEFVTSVAASSIISSPVQAAALPTLDREGVRLQLRRASAPLLTWPITLPDGSWLRRPELEQITDAIGSSADSVHLLLGEPGSGKSSLLARLAQEKQTSGWAVLAIKADRLPPETVDRATMTRYLNLSEDTSGLLPRWPLQIPPPVAGSNSPRAGQCGVSLSRLSP